MGKILIAAVAALAFVFAFKGSAASGEVQLAQVKNSSSATVAKPRAKKK